MVQKASKLPTKTDVLISHDKKINELFGLNRKRLPPLAGIFGTTPLFGATPSPSGSSGGTGNFLKTGGDTMVGPIAFFPVDVFRDPTFNFIDIGQFVSTPPDYSTYVLVAGAGDLQFIDGAGWAGQYLILQGTNQQLITVKNATILSAPTIVGDGATQIITVTTTIAHGFSIGEVIQIDSTTNFNARALVLTTPSPTTFTYDLGSVGSATPESGTAKNGTILTGTGADIPLDGTIDLLNVPVITLIFDFTVSGNGAWRVISGGAGTGASDTPWTVDHDANQFILFNLKHLLFDDAVGSFPSATNPGIFFRLTSNSLVIQVPSGQDIELQTATGSTPNIAKMDENLIDFSLNPGSEFRVQALRVLDISQFEDNMTLLIANPTGANPSLLLSQLVADTGTGGNIGSGAAPWNDLNIEQIAFREGDEIIDIASMAFRADKLRLNVATGDTIDFLFQGTLRYEWSETIFKPIFDDNVDLGTPTEQFRDLHLDGIANIDTLNFGEAGIQNTMFGFLTIVDEPTPANPFSAASVNLFLDDGTGE